MMEKKIKENLRDVVGGTARLPEDPDIKWYTREQVGSSLGPLIKFNTIQKYFGQNVWVYKNGKYTKAKIDDFDIEDTINNGEVSLEWNYPEYCPFGYIVHHEDVLLYQYIDTGLELKAPNLK